MIPIEDDVIARYESNFDHPIILPRSSSTYIGVVGSERNTSEVMKTEFYSR